MNQSYLKGALLILAAGLCYAFQPIFAKVAYEDGANAIALMLLRFLLAACLLHLYVFRQRKRRLATELTRMNVVKILAIGMLVGIGAMCYFMSLERLSIGLATLLFYLFPLYIFIFSVILRLEAMSLLKLTAVLLAIGGVYISVDLNGELPVTGILLGLSCRCHLWHLHHAQQPFSGPSGYAEQYYLGQQRGVHLLCYTFNGRSGEFSLTVCKATGPCSVWCSSAPCCH